MFPNPSSTMLLRSMGGVDPVQLTPTLAPLNATVSNPVFPPLPEPVKTSKSHKNTRPGATPLQRAGSFFNFTRLSRRKSSPKPPPPEPGSTIHLLPEDSSASEGSSNPGHRSGAEPQTTIHIDITELLENEVQTLATTVKKVRPTLLRGSPFFPTFSFQRRGEEEQGMGQGVGLAGGMSEAWRSDVEIERSVSCHVEEAEPEMEHRDMTLEGQSTAPVESVGPWKAEFDRQEEYRAEVLQGFSMAIQASEADEVLGRGFFSNLFKRSSASS